ncbi:MAG TPA: hypothetical protein DGR79_06230 [Clostridiales bacterium]|nr:hypothetical protein [Clostridiales bacterium]
MTRSRRRLGRTAAPGWGGVAVATVLCLALAASAGAAIVTENSLAARVLTVSNCRAVLRQAVPLMSAAPDAGPAAPDARDGRASRGFSAWLFASLTGISLGDPASFLEVNLPLARSSYAPAILASGREAGGAGVPAGSVPVPPESTPGSDLGGGLPPRVGAPGPVPETGVPDTGEPRREDTHLYLYGGSRPVIAIVHTHGSESFLPVVAAMARAADPEAGVSDLEAFTTDTSANIVRVGEELARYLATTHGLAVVQSRRLHDRVEDGFRLGAYKRSLETMTEILRRFPTVEILLDLHRDAPGRDKTTVVIEGRSMAAILVIVGTDRLLPHQHWEDNYEFARRLVAAMEHSHPGLSRGILVRDERYNQHVMRRTLLVEIGGQENTFEEVLASVRVLGDVLAQMVAEGFE